MTSSTNQQEAVFVIESNSAGGGVAAIQAIRRMGYRAHFLTGQPEKYESFEVNPMQIADEVSILDTNDVIRLLHFMSYQKPLAILTFDDFHVLQAAIVGQHHRLVHANLEGLVNARFKDRTRESVVGIGRTVQSVRLNLHEMHEESPIGLPCVVKPADESGSCGVRVCFSNIEFQEAVSVIQNLSPKKSGYKRAEHFLVEEYIEGDEYSAELVWDRQLEEWHLIGFTQKHLTLPYCVEIGHTFPYSFGTEIDNSLLGTIRSWLKAMQMDNGCVHLEFKMTEQGPALMEVNPRPAGGMINELVRQVQGQSIVDQYVNMMLDRMPHHIDQTESRVATVRFVMPDAYGTVLRVTPPEGEFPGVVATKLTDTKVRVFGGTSNDDRAIGYAIGLANDPQTSSDRAQAFVEACNIHYDTTAI